MTDRKRCIVKNCPNHADEGKFVGDLCGPCHHFASEGIGKNSQLYRNQQSPKTFQQILEDFQIENSNLVLQEQRAKVQSAEHQAEFHRILLERLKTEGKSNKWSFPS